MDRGQWTSGSSSGFPRLKSQFQNHWVAPKLIQLFILQRLIKWIPGISGKLVVKVNCLLEVALEPWGSWTPSTKRSHKVLLKRLLKFLTEQKILYLKPFLSLSSASDKAELFAENFLETLILMTQVSLYLFSFLELIWNCTIFL